MLSYTINKYITLKLENESTNVYVNNQLFNQCRHLLFNIPIESVGDYDEINSIDEAIEIYQRTPRYGQQEHNYDEVSPEQEFWGHCSNIQAWVEQKYDTRLLHSNLSFPFLRKLHDVGDPIAERVFKEELAKRIESAFPTVVEYLRSQNYLKFLTKEELISVIVSPQFIKNILKNAENFRVLSIIDILFQYIAPHYFKQSIPPPRELHDISPHNTEIFRELFFKILKSGKLKHFGERIKKSLCLGIIMSFCMEKKEYKKVIELCKGILDISPKSPEVWNSLGYALTLIGEYYKGIDAYKHALKLNSQVKNIDNVVAWNNIGWTYNCIEEYSKAIQACKTAIELDPKFPNPYNHLGFAYFKVGNTKKGIELIKKSIDINPNYCRAFSNLGRIYFELKNYEKSYNACYRCLKIDIGSKEGLSLFKDLITNSDLKALSMSCNLDNKKSQFSKQYLKLLRWLRQKGLN